MKIHEYCVTTIGVDKKNATPAKFCTKKVKKVRSQADYNDGFHFLLFHPEKVRKSKKSKTSPGPPCKILKNVEGTNPSSRSY